MCGILGIFNLDNKPVDKLNSINMLNKMSHRGPDGEGKFFDNNLALLHKRLSIIDPTELGSQPMISADNKWIIVFNGCIYNYKELKVELVEKGVKFKSDSDTEVIVEGLAFFGSDFIKRFNGMFAIAAWNVQDRKLHLFRDRYGIKPLYYWFNGNTFVFSSEIKSIIEHKDYKLDVDLDALNEYFTFQNIFSYNTLFLGVKMLPPANIMKLSSKTKKINHDSWWDYDFSETDNNVSLDEAVIRTRELFQTAIDRHMVSDVPVGSYLSGGIDSGSITAIASKKVNRLSTFTCGFDMNKVSGRESNFDERRDAELMASNFNTEHYEQVINSSDIQWSLPRVVYHIEDLRVGMSYPNFYISRLASKFVKVCLQGTGGDELFGGYPWRYYKVFDSLTQKEFFNQYYDYWQRLVPSNQKKELFLDKVYKKIDRNSPRKVFEKVFTFNEKLKYDTPEDHINNSLYFEIKTFLPALFLVGDKLSMASGIEERYPFMDNDLVDYAMKIPANLKLGNLDEEIVKINENKTGKKNYYREYDDGKNVLRRAMSKFIPKQIIENKKQGFSAPDESWFRGENSNYIKEVLCGPDTISTKYLRQDFINKIINEHIYEEKNHRLLIWSFLNFEYWCRIFLKNEIPK